MRATDPRNPVERQVERLVAPIAAFVREQTTASVVLLAATLLALGWANSPWASTYHSLFELPVTVSIGADASLSMPLRAWISEGLMGMFFYLIGLEIKHEMLAGELRDWQRGIPILAAAAGGMLAPAVLYLACTADTPHVRGWGIPMATDTAFAVGLLALAARHVPASLSAFITALAIIDDLGAIAIIALFYSQSLHWDALGLAAALVIALMVANLFGVRRGMFYVMGGGLVWFALLESGVHPTIAGLLVALVTPSRSKRSPAWFLLRTDALLDSFKRRATREDPLRDAQQHEIAQAIVESAQSATTPLQRWERTFEHPVSLFVMPLFALANAGLPIDADALTKLFADPLAQGVFAGLFVGKVLGISIGGSLAVWLGLGRFPRGMHYRHLIGLGWLAGIGFTMSIFIAELSFADEGAAATAKLAILCASLLSATAGYVWLRSCGRVATTPPASSDRNEPDEVRGSASAPDPARS